MSRSIQEISDFGGTAAEDDDIARFFVETPAFARLRKGERHVVLGRKGSGKTALYIALERAVKEDGGLSKGLTFAQYPWAAHKRYASADVNSTERFVASWTFLILVEAFSLLLKSSYRPADRTSIRALSSVKKFIEQNYGTINFDFKQAFPAGGFSTDSIDAIPTFGGASLGAVSSKRKTQSLGETLPRINEWLIEKILDLDSMPATFILFDELDLGFDPSNSDYVDRVVGLLLALRTLVSRLTRKNQPLHPVVFLRSDIFDRLHFGDRNKIVNAEAVLLQWHDRLDHLGSSLKHLLDFRIKEVLEVDLVDEAWGQAFTAELTRGTQHKFQHMTFRTLLRPRDVIKFANEAVASAQARFALNGGDPRISNEDLKGARDKYSKYPELEFDDEISDVEPSWRALLEALRSVGAAKFSAQAFERGYAKAERKVGVPMTSPEALAFLYDYSIIGFKAAIGAQGLDYHFKYQNESLVFEPDAREFLVHRGLKETLGLTET